MGPAEGLMDDGKIPAGELLLREMRRQGKSARGNCRQKEKSTLSPERNCGGTLRYHKLFCLDGVKSLLYVFHHIECVVKPASDGLPINHPARLILVRR